MGGGVVVVAVIPVGGVPGRGLAGVAGGGGIAVPVAIAVGVPGDLDSLVDGAIAVVVRLIADLGCTGVAGCIEIVAVIGGGHVARGLGAGVLGEAGASIAIIIRIQVPGRGIRCVVVNVSVAVVVHKVTDLHSIFVDIQIRIVTVLASCESIAVYILKAHAAVAVVVDGVRAVVFRGARVQGGVCVVAVPITAHVAPGGVAAFNRVVRGAVAVSIVVRVPGGGIGGDPFIHAAIAVVVHAVTGLLGSGVDVWIIVVAVDAGPMGIAVLVDKGPRVGRVGVDGTVIGTVPGAVGDAVQRGVRLGVTVAGKQEGEQSKGRVKSHGNLSGGGVSCRTCCNWSCSSDCAGWR